MENKILDNFKVFYFMIVTVLMYFFVNEYIDLGLYVTYRHAFALLVAVSAMLSFLIKPDIARGYTAFKSALMFSFPLLVTTVVSLFIWFVGLVDTEVITRGLSSSFVYVNMLSFALAASSVLYIFGEKGIWYNLIAILIANILMIIIIILENGLAAYFKEYIELILTFADTTGEIIVQAEVHELAFCLGAYLIYMLYKPKKSILFYILMTLAAFCFLSAFKRIAIVAMAVALLFGYILKFIAKFNEKTAYRLTIFLSVTVILILIGYVGLIKINVFELLEKAGINTSGRVGMYQAVDKYYDFHPGFLGNGIGFLTYQLNTNMSIGVASIHNDFLQHFIDLGFFGYILWLFSIITIRICYFGRKGKCDSAIIAFMLTVYLVIVSSTDNTMNYPLLSSTLAVLMIGNGFDKNVAEDEKKIFGYHVNRNSESESML